jgi:DNA-binding transcriptional LysR family regulator
MNNSELDLNLMLVFEALMRERSVTRAARALGIGQPAASNALSRLRALLRDELFVRSGGVMLPTARAHALAGPIESALATLRQAIAPAGEFDPATAERCLRISAGDYAAMILLPELTAQVRARAPRIDLRFRFVEKDRLAELLDTGALDLAIGVFPSAPKRLAVEPLFEERFVCLTRADRALPADGLTLEHYAALPHVLVTERGDETGAVDAALRAQGITRRVAVTVPHVLLLPWLLRDGDLVATVGRRAAQTFTATAPLAVHDVPLALPRWRLEMMWSRQASGDAGLVWLRGLLVAIGARV